LTAASHYVKHCSGLDSQCTFAFKNLEFSLSFEL
jgi:hypothetical protein